MDATPADVEELLEAFPDMDAVLVAINDAAETTLKPSRVPAKNRTWNA